MPLQKPIGVDTVAVGLVTITSAQQVSQNSAALNESFRRSITEYRGVDGYSYKESSMTSGYCPIYSIDPWSAGDYGL